jgi:hypothetical protein
MGVTERDEEDKMNYTIGIYDKKILEGMMVGRDDINEARERI